MENEIFNLKLDPIPDFDSIIHATGMLEFDRFPDLHKLHPTDSHICLIFSSAFPTQSLPFSPIKMLKAFFRVLICFKSW